MLVRIFDLTVVDDNPMANNLCQGFFEALSAGVLTYDALVNLVGPHFKCRNTDSVATQGMQVVSMWIGAAMMGVVGIWA